MQPCPSGTKHRVPILGMGPVLHSDWAQRNVSSLASEFMAYVEATGAFQLTTSEAELRE